MSERPKLSTPEIKRYAHKLAANAIDTMISPHAKQGYRGADFERVVEALKILAEQHRRFGPKTTDRAPGFAVPYDTPLLDHALTEQP